MQIINYLIMVLQELREMYVNYSTSFFSITIIMIIALALLLWGKEKIDKYISIYVGFVFGLGLFSIIILAGNGQYEMEYKGIENVFFLIPGIALINYSIIRVLQNSKKMAIQIMVCYLLIAFICADFTLDKSNVSYKRETFDDIYSVQKIIEDNEINRISSTIEVSTKLREIGCDRPFMYGIEDLNKNVLDLQEDEMYIQKINEMNMNPSDLNVQLAYSREYGCDCIILDASYDNEIFMVENGTRLLGRTNSYVVYKIEL